MSDFYLNDPRREFYSNALKLIRNCENEGWRLDNGLDKYMDLINSSKNVRTMYSRRGPNRSGYGLESYLKICYSKEAEPQIKTEIEPKLKTTLETSTRSEFASRPEFIAYYIPPKVRMGNKQAAPFLRYIEDDNYWNVFHIKFELKGGYPEDHDRFWSTLSESLSKL